MKSLTSHSRIAGAAALIYGLLATAFPAVARRHAASRHPRFTSYRRNRQNRRTKDIPMYANTQLIRQVPVRVYYLIKRCATIITHAISNRSAKYNILPA